MTITIKALWQLHIKPLGTQDVEQIDIVPTGHFAFSRDADAGGGVP